MTKSILEVHTKIAKDAAWNANRDIQQSQLYANILAVTLGGEAFRPSPEETLEHSISLRWIEELDESPQELLDELHRVGTQAIKEAIIENKEWFVGLIVGMAKNGDNYFDLFRL